MQGDLGSGVAPIAFAYGDANLKLGVASNQAWVNNEVRKKQKQDQQNGAEAAAQQPSADPEEGEEQEEDEEHVLSREDIEETFEIAFECLDTSRVIYERLVSQETGSKDKIILQKRLGEVMMRLGDLKFEQGLFEDAVAEYNKCLETRVQAEEATSRDLASTYHALALTEESIAVDKPNELVHLVQAAKFYSKALEVLRFRRAQILGSDAGTGAEPSSGSKKKAVKTKNWISVLTPEQIELVEAACNTSVAVIMPEPSEADSAEAKELASIVSDLCGKVEDITWLLTEEGKAEQDKAAEEKAKEQAEAAKAGVTTEGFGVSVSEQQPVTSENVPPSTIVSNTENPVAKQATPQPNVLQPRKREKLIPQNSNPSSVA